MLVECEYKQMGLCVYDSHLVQDNRTIVVQTYESFDLRLKESLRLGSEQFFFNIFSSNIFRKKKKKICFPPEIVAWMLILFENSFGIKNYFTKYLKESCC